MEYTKGEWRIIKDVDNRTHIMGFESDFERNVCMLSVRSPEEVEANAHLIASAPDLYEALKAVYKRMEMQDRVSRALGEEGRDILLEQVIKVLAKAESK